MIRTLFTALVKILVSHNLQLIFHTLREASPSCVRIRAYVRVMRLRVRAHLRTNRSRVFRGILLK